MPDPKPPVAEMKRLLFARIAELRELEGRYRETLLPPTMTYAHARYDVCRIAQRTFRASLDAHEAFLKVADSRHDFVNYQCKQCRVFQSCIEPGDECSKSEGIAQIQALYEALCGASQ